MRSSVRFVVIAAAILLTASVSALAAETVQPAAGPQATQQLPLFLTAGAGNMSHAVDVPSPIYTTDCETQRTACFASCPQSGPDKFSCFQQCQCQYLMCIGARCTD